VGVERGPLSLVSTTEELLGRISSGSGLEIREYGLGDQFLGESPTFHRRISFSSSGKNIKLQFLAVIFLLDSIFDHEHGGDKFV
jgi:hypothetical protein